MDRDPAYLLDMLNAAREVQALSQGLTCEAFQQSKLHQYALVKLIEIIGEAARAITEETKAAHPEIPWVPIIDMRNHLIHRYFRIDLPRVWDVVENHIAPLIAQLEPLVPPDQP
ncbi:MAG: DUF86 domain-containing protein [Acidobacteria bacterium]|nr:DUF86 domain-containing protein [Acidobacteriota bacterium]